MKSCPECGLYLDSTGLKCPFCGYRVANGSNLESTVRDADALNNIPMRVPERTRAYSKQSLREVKKDYKVEKRKKFLLPLSNLQHKLTRRRSKKTIGMVLTLVLVGFFLMLPTNQKYAIYEYLGAYTRYTTNFQEDIHGFAFLKKAKSGIPQYWPGCTPLTVEIRQNYASASDISIVKDALDELSKPYARVFRIDGFTNNVKVENSSSQILIDFTSKEESQALTEAALKHGYDIAGLGGPELVVPFNEPLIHSEVIKRGQIWIEKGSWFESEDNEKKALIMHEMGHVLGLGHPELKNGEVMGYNHGVKSLGSGDKLGLQILSALAECRPMPEYLLKKP